MKIIRSLAAVAFLLAGASSAFATDNGDGPIGDGNFDCFRCFIHAWGPISYSECVSTPVGNKGGCYVEDGKCKYHYEGCSSLPDDPILTRGIAL